MRLLREQKPDERRRIARRGAGTEGIVHAAPVASVAIAARIVEVPDPGPAAHKVAAALHLSGVARPAAACINQGAGVTSLYPTESAGRVSIPKRARAKAPRPGPDSEVGPTLGATERKGGRLAVLGESYAGYRIHDRDGEEVGKLSDLFLDEHDRPEYIGVNADLPEGGLVLIPIEAVTVNGERGVMQVSETGSRISGGPLFDSRAEMCPEYESRLRDHYGLENPPGPTDRRTRAEIGPAASAPLPASPPRAPAFPVAATLLILGATILSAMLARRLANRR